MLAPGWVLGRSVFEDTATKVWQKEPWWVWPQQAGQAAQCEHAGNPNLLLSDPCLHFLFLWFWAGGGSPLPPLQPPQLPATCALFGQL